MCISGLRSQHPKQPHLSSGTPPSRIALALKVAPPSVEDLILEDVKIEGELFSNEHEGSMNNLKRLTIIRGSLEGNVTIPFASLEELDLHYVFYCDDHEIRLDPSIRLRRLVATDSAAEVVDIRNYDDYDVPHPCLRLAPSTWIGIETLRFDVDLFKDLDLDLAAMQSLRVLETYDESDYSRNGARNHEELAKTDGVHDLYAG